MLLFRTCCFVIPLRIGSLVIGYLHLVYHVIQSILAIIILASGVELAKLDEDFKVVANIVIAHSAIMLFFLLVFIGFTVFLLIGLHKDRRGYVKGFLIYALIFLIVYTILFFVSIGFGYIGVWNIIFGILEIILGTYFLFVVRSQYIAMGSTGINGA